MNEWHERRWLRRHAIAAPFGIFAATALLVARSGQWSGWESLELAAGMVDLGAVLYAMVAVLAERGVDMVFWALERKKQREQENRARNEAQGKADLIADLMADGIPQTKQELAQWAREKGIPLNNLPPR